MANFDQAISNAAISAQLPIALKAGSSWDELPEGAVVFTMVQFRKALRAQGVQPHRPSFTFKVGSKGHTFLLSQMANNSEQHIAKFAKQAEVAAARKSAYENQEKGIALLGEASELLAEYVAKFGAL